jgi:hypothetical protein
LRGKQDECEAKACEVPCAPQAIGN